ncbi:RagB/SusD family nutrient uptake outer membrane protein [Algibacter miyuki]|uniref:RagB/SusD family nutrient uptake outer membrane protein n=1 Tax=Algibacter miyuki TaxID=1306933 RepID=A0ABV5H4T9_9FLAO|nr:RagB/SusD family nutrient uptake outer membrane protein [Algibacter miyuki]MDN3665821.1 RagB/SusD family nutrient uptake outer membrane protein [Algibacter miyuki]
MKKSIIKIFIMVPMLFATLSSCSDYLDLEPKNNLIQQEFWKNKEQVSSAVAGCYASMNQSGFTDRVLKWGELRAEMMVSGSGGLENIMRNYMLPSDGLTNWSTFYATINYCNLVLEFADGAQELDQTFSIAELKTFKAEAITIRSLAYLILVKNFKEVPLVLTATSTNQIDFYPAKNTEQEILSQIISDLTLAVEDLNIGYSQSTAHDKGRMTKGAALAILTDAYLWNEQYTECIDAAQDLMDLGRYSLVNGDEWFNSIFFEGNSDEGIFELQFSDISTTIRNSFQVANLNYVAYQGMSELFREFPDDVRGHLGTFDRENSAVFKYAGVDETGEYRGSDEFYNNFIFYRYADIILMQAEAYILSEDKKDLDAAYELISSVHERAVSVPLDVSKDESSLLEALLLERQKELAFEGKRWYDLLRFARRNNFANQELIINLVDFKAGADDYEQILSYYSDPDSYFLPIYQNEINLNDNLVQNPFYEN